MLNVRLLFPSFQTLGHLKIHMIDGVERNRGQTEMPCLGPAELLSWRWLERVDLVRRMKSPERSQTSTKPRGRQVFRWAPDGCRYRCIWSADRSLHAAEWTMAGRAATDAPIKVHARFHRRVAGDLDGRPAGAVPTAKKTTMAPIDRVSPLRVNSVIYRF